MAGFKNLKENPPVEEEVVEEVAPATPPSPTSGGSIWGEIESAANEVTESAVFCGIIGHEGTCKTGIVLDSIKDDENILIVDFDNGGKTLRSSYYRDKMHNIRALNPWVFQKGTRDAVHYPNTHQRVIDIMNEAVDWAERQKEPDYTGPKLGTVLVTALDLWDTVAKNCMFIEDLGTAPDGIGAKVKPHEKVGMRFNWQIRSTRFHMLTALCRQLMSHGVRVFVETHLKEEYDGHKPSGEYKPDWEKQMGNYLHQIVCMHKTPVRDDTGAKTGEVRYEAEFHKWRTNSDLVDQRRTVMVTQTRKPAQWHGLPELRGEI